VLIRKTRAGGIELPGHRWDYQGHCTPNREGRGDAGRDDHAFMDGLLLGLEDKYQITSNRETDYDCYDTAMKHKRRAALTGLILEDKQISDGEPEPLMEQALTLIRERDYATERAT